MNNSKFLLLLSKKISMIFNPIFNASISFILIILTYSFTEIYYKIIYLIVSLVFSAIIPLFFIVFYKKIKSLNKKDFQKRKERIIPLIGGIISYILGFLLLRILGAPLIIQGLMFCYATNTLIVLLLTNFWKVSIHTTAIGGPIVALNYHFGHIILPFYFLVLVVGISRFILKRHTLTQVLGGIIIGIGLTIFQFKIFFN
ncbi:hypothetical protein JXB41_07690 [Candidatus Woesearchaeota archaeon]|nr:hypothetical protein [Candidatus Woesearchaeota archaeon]